MRLVFNTDKINLKNAIKYVGTRPSDTSIHLIVVFGSFPHFTIYQIQLCCSNSCSVSSSPMNTTYF